MLGFFKKVSVVSLFVLLAACSSNSEINVDFRYLISAASDINPDIEGRPSSVIVRVYQLTDKINFENANYDELFERGHNVWGT